MDSLEYAVRPYQTPNSQGKIIIPSTPSATTDRATITWTGKGANLPKPTGGIGVTCCSEQLNEDLRQGTVVRIFGPDPGDGSGPSYVDVFRTTTMLLKKKSQVNCGGWLDQYLNTEFGLDPVAGDTTVASFFQTVLPDDTSSECGTAWNFTYAGVSGA
jgi:hypothetical protein